MTGKQRQVSRSNLERGRLLLEIDFAADSFGLLTSGDFVGK